MATQPRSGGTVNRLIVGLANVSMAVAALGVLAMCLLVTGAVVVRYVFNWPVVWVPEIVGYLMVALVFLALGETMLAGRHIKIDLVVGRLPRRLRDVVELLTLTLSVGVAGFFTWHGLNTMLRSLDYGRRDAFGALNMPLWIPQMAMPIGLSILTLVAILLACRKLRDVLYGSGPDDSESDPQVGSTQFEAPSRRGGVARRPRWRGTPERGRRSTRTCLTAERPA